MSHQQQSKFIQRGQVLIHQSLNKRPQSHLSHTEPSCTWWFNPPERADGGSFALRYVRCWRYFGRKQSGFSRNVRPIVTVSPSADVVYGGLAI